MKKQPVTKYNGNDLNWEYLEGVNMICMDCLQARAEAGYDLMTDEQKEQYDEEHELACDGHDFIYFEHTTIPTEQGSTTSLELFENWYQFMIEHPSEVLDLELIDFLDWYIIHYTNGNFVVIHGDYPLNILTEEALLQKGKPTPKKKVNRDE